MRFPRTLLVTLVALASTLSVVASASAATKAHATKAAASSTVVIGYENFSEPELVAYMYGDLLTAAGYKVSYKSAGARAVAIPALESGAIQVLPEYAGSLTVYLDAKAQKQAGTLSTAEAFINSTLKSKNIVALPAIAGLDQNDFVVTAATAAKYKLTTLSSLKSVASKLILGGPPECPTNYFCEPGLKSIYGLSFKSFKGLDESGPLSVAALKNNSAQVVELFSTDGVIPADHFVSLADNLNLEPADHILPLVAKSLDVSKVTTALAKINKVLTTSVLIQLEDAMSTGTHPSAATVASGFLATEKIS